MSRNYYDQSCTKCETTFVVIIGNPVKCPECGFVIGASPEPTYIKREREFSVMTTKAESDNPVEKTN